MSFTDQMTGAWVANQHAAAAAREDAQTLRQWIEYARKLQDELVLTTAMHQANNVEVRRLRGHIAEHYPGDPMGNREMTDQRLRDQVRANVEEQGYRVLSQGGGTIQITRA